MNSLQVVSAVFLSKKSQHPAIITSVMERWRSPIDPEYLLETGDYASAIDGFRQQLAESPNNPSIRGKLAEAYLLSGDRERAFYHFDQTAKSFFNMGNDGVAADFLLRADEVLPNEPEIIYRLAQCYERLGKNRELLDSCERLEQYARADGDRRRLWALERLVTSQPSHAAWSLDLIKLYLRFDWVEKAVQVAHQVLSTMLTDRQNVEQLRAELSEITIEHPALQEPLAYLDFYTDGPKAALHRLHLQLPPEHQTLKSLELTLKCHKVLGNSSEMRTAQQQLLRMMLVQGQVQEAIPLADLIAAQQDSSLDALELAARVYSLTEQSDKAGIIWRHVLLSYHDQEDVPNRERVLVDSLRSAPNAIDSLKAAVSVLKASGRATQAIPLERRIHMLLSPKKDRPSDSSPPTISLRNRWI